MAAIEDSKFIEDKVGHLIQFVAGDSSNLYAKIPVKNTVVREDEKDGGKTYHICDENNKDKTWSFSFDKDNAKKWKTSLNKQELRL